jgi:exopolysaccharide biosynthesis polyprenyl glycosylphosphotransferase
MKTSFYSYINNKKVLLAGDVLLVFFAFFLAISIKLKTFEPFRLHIVLAKVDWMVVFWTLLYPITFYVFELYNQERWKHNIRLLVYISSAVLVTTGIVGCLSYVLLPNIVIGRTILSFHMIFSIIFIFAWRKIFDHFFLNGKNGKDKVLLIGNSLIVDDIESIVKKNDNKELDDLAVIREYSENPGTVSINGSITEKNLYELVMDSGFSTVVVADRLKHFPALRKQLLELRFSGVAIYDAPYFYEALTSKVPVNQVKESWFLFHNQGDAFNPFIYRKIKKIIDKSFAVIGIFLSFPLMLTSALAIKITSKGPVFFKQERLGQNERPFTLIKFRTMIDNAEKDNGPQWAGENDRRITKIGKILRKTHLDELPQLFNILKGDMSFVGPRPIRKHFADILAKDIPYYRFRFVVKPGLTGWAQVRGDYAGSEEGQAEKLEYDLYYIQNQSILFDLFIVLKTVQTVLFRRGQ